MCELNQQNYSANLRHLCDTADRIARASPSELQEQLRYYINYYVQHKRRSEQFFMYLCEHNILNRLFTAPIKSLSSLAVLQLFHLLISNTSCPNDLVYIFSQPIVHEWLFEKFSIYKEREEAIEYYVQLLKTIVMKAAGEGNDFLIRLFCNKRFPTFPLLTAATLLAVSPRVDELVRITAQQCVLLLVNLINSARTGLVYLNELQMVVFFHQLVRQMLDETTNQDKEGSIKYFIDLAFTLRNNQTSRYLLFNLLANHLFFKYASSPAKTLCFIRELRELSLEGQDGQDGDLDETIGTLLRIFRKYHCSQFVNYTYFNAQRIIPTLPQRQQPPLLAFYAHRCRKIDQYLVNEGDYEKSEKGNECLLEEWLQYNSRSTASPLRSSSPIKKNPFTEFFSFSEDTVQGYIREVMTMAGLEVEKLKSPIIKLTFSANFATALFLVETITGGLQAQQTQEEFCRESWWRLDPSQDLFAEIYLMYLNLQGRQTSTIILEDRMEGQNDFLVSIQPQLTELVVSELCKQDGNLGKHYLLLLFKLISKFNLRKHLRAQLIERLLRRLFQLQKVVGELVFLDECFPSFLKYIFKNQERAYVKDKLDAEGLKGQKAKLNKPKEVMLQHLLFYYQVVQRFLDSSLKVLNEFVDEYWRSGLAKRDVHGLPKPLMLCKDVNKNYLEVYASSRFDFEVVYRTKSEEKARFSIRDTDFPNNYADTQKLTFQEYKVDIFLESTEAVVHFKEDINSIRETRKEIFRQAVLQYMPFIYESIEVKYRSHHLETNTPQL